MPYTYEVETNRLQRAVDNGFFALDSACKMRETIFRHAAGSMYGGWDGQKIPINLIHQTLYVMAANLMSGAPRMLIKADPPSLMPAARVYAKTIERTWWANCFKDSARLCVLDAMAGVGIMKMGVAGDYQAPGYNGYPSPGNVFYDRCDLDDLTIDPNCRGLKAPSFVGNKYLMVTEWARLIPGANQDKITAASRTTDDKQGVAKIGNRDLDTADTQLTDYVNLVDVYIHHHKIVVTMAYGSGGVQVIAINDWKGPAHGPYRFLAFNELPNNVMPVPPLSVVFDLHEATNMHFRKLLTQAQRSKTIYAYAPGGDDDAQTVQLARDGSVVQVDDPKNIAEITYAGPSADMYQHNAFMQNVFSQQAGNIDLTAGIGAGAKTLGQSQILMGNINQRLNFYRNRVNEFFAGCGEDAGYYLHDDPLVNETLSIEDQISGGPMEVYYNPQVRQGDFYQYQFKCEAWQEPYTDEQTKFGRLMQFLVEGIPAAYQAEQVSQFAMNAQRIIRNLSQKMDIDGEIAEAFRDDETAARLIAEHRQIMMQEQQSQMTNSMGASPQGQSLRMMDRGTNSAPQMAGGRRDSTTVANGKYSSQAMSGSTLGASQAGRQRY